MGNQRQNTPYGQETAFVEGKKKTRQERVKVDGLFHGDFVAVPSNKWWQTVPLTEASIYSKDGGEGVEGCIESTWPQDVWSQGKNGKSVNSV